MSQNDWSPTLVCSVRGDVGNATRWAIEHLTDFEIPAECPTCSAPTVRIVWNCVLFSPTDIDKPEVQSGQLLIGSQVDRHRTVPDWVCLNCQPRWSEVHELAVRDCQLQIAKENAIEAQDFNKARQMRDLQFDFRPKLNAIVDELLAA